LSDTADFEIGAKVSCTDGSGGDLVRVVIDPDARTVTHLVVEPEHRVGLGRLVPVSLAQVTPDGIRLSCTLAEFAQFEISEHVETLPGDQPGSVLGNAPLLPNAQLFTNLTLPVVVDVVPDGRVEIESGKPVHATDGEIGVLQGVVAGEKDDGLEYLLLREGHLWGRRQLAIPMASVTAVDDTGIWLSITKDQVRDLPPLAPG
jgi:hypothetical protein